MQSTPIESKCLPAVTLAVAAIMSLGCGKSDVPTTNSDQSMQQFTARPLSGLDSLEPSGPYEKLDKIDAKDQARHLIHSTRNKFYAIHQRGVSDPMYSDPEQDGHAGKIAKGLEDKCTSKPHAEVSIEIDKDTLIVNGTLDLSACTAEIVLSAGTEATLREYSIIQHTFELYRCVGRDISHLKHLAGKRSGLPSELAFKAGDLDFLTNCEEIERQSREEIHSYMAMTIGQGAYKLDKERETKSLKVMATKDNEPCRFSQVGLAGEVGPCMVATRSVNVLDRSNEHSNDDEGQESLVKFFTEGITFTKNEGWGLNRQGSFELTVNNWNGQGVYGKSNSANKFELTDGIVIIEQEISNGR